MIIDTRARRQRHLELPLPKRPPLPYETVVHRSPQHQGGGTDSDGDIHADSEINKLQETTVVVATPADYEVVVPATGFSKSLGKILTSGTKSKLPPRENENGMSMEIVLSFEESVITL